MDFIRNAEIYPEIPVVAGKAYHSHFGFHIEGEKTL
jgi:hypothetical protein